MATLYAKQQVGVLDGTVKPSKQADGSEVNGNKRSLMATKVTGTQWAVGDQIVLGKVPAGRKVVGVRCCTDTSLGTTTVSVGTATAPTKYVNAKTVTNTDTPGLIGPNAAAISLDPLAVEETLIATIGVAAVPGAVVLAFDIETVGK